MDHLGPGLAVGELRLQLHGWSAERRFVVIREQVREGRDSVGRKLIEVPGYTFRVFVTSCADPPEEIWRGYNRRADMENRIAELKHDLCADGFCLKQFFATRPPFAPYYCCSTCWPSSNVRLVCRSITSRLLSGLRSSPAALFSVELVAVW